MSSTQQQQQQLKRGKGDKGGAESSKEKVVVAVKASKEISRTALVWALTHVVQPGDCITLLVVVPPHSSGRNLWGFPRFAGDCASGHKKSNSVTTLEQKSDITESCSQMMLRLHDIYDPNKINVKIKVVSGSPSGSVAAESTRAQANWVVLDKDLKNEEKRCMEELRCNIVVMKRSQPKVLRLNLVPEKQSQLSCPSVPELNGEMGKATKDIREPRKSIRGPAVTPNSSPETDTPFTGTEAGHPLSLAQIRGLHLFFKPSDNLRVPALDGGILCARTSSAKALLEKFTKLDTGADIGTISSRSDLSFRGNVREAVSLSRTAPPGPPPLCSVCQHKAPVFGKPPRWFTYSELELATNGFSKANFLAEGGFGSVHRGVLPDGQAIAVKQHKLASSQGDLEFCSEVEVLSCAQHRNVVMLIGFCVEDKRRLLVYEYICNGSLDSHLYGRNREPLEWAARQKIAVGAARGLRYLHEECRVGCIVHRDMRPNNILVTHDFEPLVGDFGLARWQPDGDLGVETRVIGTFGYLAPEYAQSGQITEKADVYSFGVVLVELVTGRKAIDINRPKGQQCLTEWARPLLEEYAIDKLIDPRLGHLYCEEEVYCMLHAASLCIRRDPHARPRMSQVLRILEGDMLMDSGYISTPRYDHGNRSRRILTDQPKIKESSNISDSKHSYEALRAAWDRERESLARRC
uniref:Protein kinase domain-containing protein n=1 Tax=Ananas comosus var. bracteatus TaxID=296719 RepID=A0A6V7P009_ANACO|nr:unnamed protein product [Ananas comosus var. bracteatus]